MRRWTFLAISALIAAICLVFIGAGAGLAQDERFDGVTLRVASYGGPWNETLRQLVGVELEKRGAKVEYVLGEPTDNLAKLIVARGKEPPFDVVEVDPVTFRSFLEGGFLQTINMNNIRNRDELAVRPEGESLVPIWLTQEGVIYNAVKFKELGIAKPERYSDLVNPRLSGRVGFPDINRSAALFAVLGFALEYGGNERNIEPAFPAIKKLGAVKYSKSSAGDATAFKNGDIWAFFAHAGWAARLRKGGLEHVSFAHLKFGERRGVIDAGYMGIVKGSKNLKAAEFFISRYISADVQEALARSRGIVPVNSKAMARLTDDLVLKEMLLLSPEDVRNMYPLDLSKVDFAEWANRWNRVMTQ